LNEQDEEKNEAELLNLILNESMDSFLMCKLCKSAGHDDRNCPNKGTILRPPSGIPKSNWIIVGSEKKITTNVELNARKAILLDICIDPEPTKLVQPGNIVKIPSEFKCPFDDHIIKDAVLIPCCGSFICCDSCILNKIYNDELIECINKNCNKEMKSLQFITPCYHLREKINAYNNNLKEIKKLKEPNKLKNNLIKYNKNSTNKKNYDNLIDSFFGIKRKHTNLDFFQEKKQKIY
jgi:hypothetical protein